MSDDARALWEAHAHTDPLWAVLSEPDKRGRRWRLQEFMQSGEREIARLMRAIDRLRIERPSAPVLDFGCGVGRLTQALARRYDSVVGADISPRMVALATRVNKYPDRARYICTSSEPIESLPPASFGFIYSNIVLQHMPPRDAVRTLETLLGLLVPGGLLVFQLPSHKPIAEAIEIVGMADDAYSGTITPAGALPEIAIPGEEIAVPILVRNVSARTWSQPGAGPMAAGNHWLDAAGAMVQQDDGRTPLPQMMKAGAEVRLVLRVHAPAAPGEYTCEIDLVHEGVTWFAGRGSRTLRFPLHVRAQATRDELDVPEYDDAQLPPPTGGVQAPPESDPFPMHGVPREEVLRVIEASGARAVHVEQDGHAGADWVSFTYFVKSGDRPRFFTM